ncbi:DUF6397 family protein [Streptomyces sp. HPF1205]|uniref:DUF6397 family protein n=1 Tax=Streptomyces sp. HPF1205 TaxID=2873262 RepID=UPI001CED7457|nr:DUF6397 family protein [Streptomyces sp. HPF1205]
MKTTKESRQALWTPGAGQALDHGSADGELVTLGRARDELGLDEEDFHLAVQVGEVPTVACGSGLWKVRARELERLRAADGGRQALLARIQLVSSGEGAKAMGVGRDRFTKLARTGFVRPVRWYVNRYRALVWMYPARELREFAEANPALMTGPLPGALREAVEGGEDLRGRGWRDRRVAQLVRDAYDAWDEAAVWAALLGPERVHEAVPDPYERGRLRRLREALPPGRVGFAAPELVRRLTTADHPEEIATALAALADALGRARESRPVLHLVAPETVQPSPPVPVPLPVPVPGPRVGAAGLSGQAPPACAARPAPVACPPRAAAGGRRGLLGLLRGRRSAADPAEQPLLHHGHQKTPAAVEDLAARQPSGAGRDG